MAVERSKERWRIVIGALVVLIGAAGCSWYSTGPKPPAQARVQVTGTGPLLIITSEAFDRTVNDSTGVTEMVLYQADTATSSLPFDSAYDVAPSDRFLVRVDPVQPVLLAPSREDTEDRKPFLRVLRVFV
ncbi:MAG: hypothetical protein P8099_18330 [Gemmatimonadota bacterium]